MRSTLLTNIGVCLLVAGAQAKERSRQAVESVAMGQMTDPRDHKTYPTVAVKSQTWMARNLDYKTGRSWCYERDEKNCRKYGRLYDWQTARIACPEGWHLPSDQEWSSLGEIVDGHGKALRAKSWSGTDAIGFNALPGGSYGDAGFFVFENMAAYFWSSTEYDSQNAWRRGLDAHTDSLRRYSNFKVIGFSVRCAKDRP